MKKLFAILMTVLIIAVPTTNVFAGSHHKGGTKGHNTTKNHRYQNNYKSHRGY